MQPKWSGRAAAEQEVVEGDGGDDVDEEGRALGEEAEADRGVGGEERRLRGADPAPDGYEGEEGEVGVGHGFAELVGDEVGADPDEGGGECEAPADGAAGEVVDEERAERAEDRGEEAGE